MGDDDKIIDTGAWQRIDLEDRDEISNWARSFSVSDDQLIEAVRKVGIRASTVRAYFEKMRIPS